MDFVDLLLNRIEGESELKKPTHVLVCFTKPETGKRLSRLATDLVPVRAEKSSITLLYFPDDREALSMDEPIEVLQHKLLSAYVPKDDRGKITMRLFIRDCADFVAEIRKVAEEQHCNLLLIGVDANEAWVQHAQSGIFPPPDEQADETAQWKNISNLLSDNKIPTGIFMDKGSSEMSRIFIPVLCRADVHIFAFVFLLAQKETIRMMVWDAVGIIETEPKMQKLFQYMVKKSDGRIHRWDNNKKIENVFIEKQDMVITGIDGWNKLMAAPLSWKKEFPTSLIIKDSSS